jgi:acyl carrier protein
MHQEPSQAGLRSIVTAAVAEVSGAPEAELRDDSKLFQDLGLESIDIVDIFFEIERRLPKKMNLIQALRDRQGAVRFDISVGEMVQLIEERLVS